MSHQCACFSDIILQGNQWWGRKISVGGFLRLINWCFVLCFNSKLSIVTHHSSQAAATKLEYDHNGKLLSKQPCARDLGTTVSLQNLFSTLPVRHREFLRNIRREFTKLVHVLQGYCLISTGVRITCSNQAEKGKKTMIVSTNGSEQVKDNITCVFGPKQVCKICTCFDNLWVKFYNWNVATIFPTLPV